MKNITSLSLILMLNSCGETDHSELYGSWRTLTDPKYASTNIKDSVVFLRPDSLKIYMLQDGEFVSAINGKFYFKKDKSYLTTEYDNQKFNFEVLELTERSLKLKETGKKVIQNYRRL